jgi:hypothetical protein
MMMDHHQELVRAECWRWASKGVNVKYEVRDSRRGYKAGALREGMKRAYARGCDLVAIFDADFQPEPDFLWRAVPFLLHNPDLALVQARWKFGTSFLPHVRTPASDPTQLRAQYMEERRCWAQGQSVPVTHTGRRVLHINCMMHACIGRSPSATHVVCDAIPVARRHQSKLSLRE